MVRRVIGQEELFGTDRQGPTELDDLACLIDWGIADALMAGLSSSNKGALSFQSSAFGSLV